MFCNNTLKLDLHSLRRLSQRGPSLPSRPPLTDLWKYTTWCFFASHMHLHGHPPCTALCNPHAPPCASLMHHLARWCGIKLLSSLAYSSHQLLRAITILVPALSKLRRTYRWPVRSLENNKCGQQAHIWQTKPTVMKATSAHMKSPAEHLYWLTGCRPSERIDGCLQ